MFRQSRLHNHGIAFCSRTNPLTYNSYLTSPIVEIIVGQGENETTLTAHQTLLLESPFLAETVNKFSETEPACFVILR